MEIGLNLSLTEEEDAGLRIPENDWDQNKEAENLKLIVVGRLLSHRGTNFDALKNMLASLFQPVKGMVLRRITEDWFCIQFNHRLDLQRAIDCRPWTFDKNLLIIEPILQGLNPTEINLDWCPFLVYVHDLSLSQHNPAMAKHIGNHIGRYLDIEHHENGFGWSSTFKIRIALDVTRPLKRALRLRNDQGDNKLVTFTYDRLPNFCYLCGCLGHIAKFCPKRYEDDFVDPGEALSFGPWLRANNQPRFNNIIPSSHRQTQNIRSRPSFSSSEYFSESGRKIE
ncbi:UNVERIFIED_CONTAM: hypothetical protein Sradi_1766100 [Sesamum radiatum]|uniref:CCHC-type domain-containing protein n=1 Tax=Sesamum radiatum TaxID=300843 RepID=A0AAW2TUU9_SESRA